MKPEDSLPQSQEPPTFLYPDSDKSSPNPPHRPLQLLEDLFNIVPQSKVYKGAKPNLPFTNCSHFLY